MEVGIRNAEVGPVVVPNERDYVAVYMGKLEFGIRNAEVGMRKSECGSRNSERGDLNSEWGMRPATSSVESKSESKKKEI